MPSPDTNSPEQSPWLVLLPFPSVCPFSGFSVYLPWCLKEAPFLIFQDIPVVIPGLELSPHLRADHLHHPIWSFESEDALPVLVTRLSIMSALRSYLGPSAGPLKVSLTPLHPSSRPSHGGSTSGEAPVTGPRCPAALPDPPCGERCCLGLVWRALALYESGCLSPWMVRKSLGSCWLVFIGLLHIGAFPASYHTDDASHQNLFSWDSHMSVITLTSLNPQTILPAGLPFLLYIGRNSASEISLLAKDRFRIHIHTWTQRSTDASLLPLALTCLLGCG